MFDDGGMRGESSGMPVKSWVLYVLRCSDDSLYCGITNDLPHRIGMHNTGRGAKYTRGRGPVVLIKSWKALDKPAALKAERAFKKLDRKTKELKLRSRSRKDEVSCLLRGEKLTPPSGRRTRASTASA